MITLTPKILDSVFFALVFFILASPLTFRLVDKVIGQPLLRKKLIENGVPTRLGMVVHALVFGIIFYFFSKC